MTKKQTPDPTPRTEPAPNSEPRPSPEPQKSEPHHDVESPTFERANDRMKLAAEPNDGQPLAHRDRAKAGRKG